MSNLPLQPLKWHEQQGWFSTKSPLTEYQIAKQSDKYRVLYIKRSDQFAREATGFATIDEAKQWAWKHYNEKMQPYVKPDSIADIRNWFKAAKPEPTDKDRLTQIGCHFEEVDEMTVALTTKNSGMDKHSSKELSDNFKSATFGNADIQEVYFSTVIDRIELLDALCDQIVTATGVAYMMGFDIEGALKEVIRSNNSKMVDGKFEFDDNGKIAKPSSYSKPDLTPFVSTMQNLHKGE